MTMMTITISLPEGRAPQPRRLWLVVASGSVHNNSEETCLNGEKQADFVDY